MAKSAENQFKPWTESDVAELQSFVDEDMSVEEIARELGRTVEAVRAKAAEEASRYCQARRWAISTSRLAGDRAGDMLVQDSGGGA